MQSPAFLKQIAGRAVEQTTTELSTSGKSGGKGEEFDSRLAERLTKNIVEELSARWGSATIPSFQGLPLASSSLPTSPPDPALAFEERLKKHRSRIRLQRERKRAQLRLSKVIDSISGATLEPSEDDLSHVWENMIRYKDKTVAVDFRYGSGADMAVYDRSIGKLFDHTEVDGLVFMFSKAPPDVVRNT